MSAAVSIPSSPPAASQASIRVLTVTPFFPSQQNPSQGCFIAEPLNRLQQLGIENEVIAASPFYRSAQTSCVSGCQWISYLSVPGNLGLVASRSLLLQALRSQLFARKRRPEVSLVHAHTALPCGEAAMLLARELGVPFVLTVHGLDVFAERQAGWWFAPWTKRRSLEVYRKADRLVCISKRVSRELPEEVQHQVRIVPNGVDSAMFTPEEERPGRLTILSVGNLIPTKGHAILLRAFARISSVTSAELAIIGDGPERGFLSSLAQKLGIDSRVRFLGRVDRQTLAAAMRGCSVFALPSRYEGLGCVYLEAMACGKPAIGCAGQGIEEVIRDGDNGFLVAPEDEARLARTLAMLLQDPLSRKKIGVAARQTIVQKHTLEHQARELAAVYAECLQ